MTPEQRLFSLGDKYKANPASLTATEYAELASFGIQLFIEWLAQNRATHAEPVTDIVFDNAHARHQANIAALEQEIATDSE